MSSRFRWSERMKVSARTKLVSAVREAGEPEAADAARRHEELLARLDAQQRDVADLQSLVHDLEARMRRDISFASDVEAVASSADFAEASMAKVRSFTHPHETLTFALGAVSIDGLALEFGVASGTTLRIIADCWHADHNVGVVAGFDTFTGLPQTWRTGFEKGTFAQESKPDVPGAFLIEGLFEETLGTFLSKNREPVAFLHIDADLYSAADFVLRRLDQRIVRGTVIVFDEFFNFPGWQDHEFRAWEEFVARTGTQFEYLGYTVNNEQVAIKVTTRTGAPSSRD